MKVSILHFQYQNSNIYWFKNEPINYKFENVVETQDIEPVLGNKCFLHI